MTTLLDPNVPIPDLPDHLAGTYAAKFPPLETPVEYTGLYLADASGRTIATRWDAFRYEAKNGTAMTARRQAEVDSALMAIADRVNVYDDLAGALRLAVRVLEALSKDDDCTEGQPEALHAARLALAKVEKGS